MNLLSYEETQQLERELRMQGGYVLCFSNPQFENFFKRVVGVDITAPQFALKSGSKANRLRAFWEQASPKQLISFFDGLLDGWTFHDENPPSEAVSKIISQITSRLKKSSSTPRFEDRQFDVALSFSGAHREYVLEVANQLRQDLGEHAVFYDNFYPSYLAKPNLDNILQRLYRRRASLVVVFLSANYKESKWCGIEWRAVQNIIMEKQGDQLMLVRFDDHEIEGIFDQDGYIDARSHNPSELVRFIIERLEDNRKSLVITPEKQRLGENSNIPQIFDQIRMVTAKFPVNKDELSKDHEEILLSLSKAYHATERYYIYRSEHGRSEEREWDVAEKWYGVGVRMKKFDRELALRLDRKSEFWRNGASWSEDEIKEAGIDLEGVWSEVRKRLDVP